MNNLYEYIDPIASPYEAFLFDSTRDLLPIPAHWHYYVELLYVRKGEIEVSLDNVVSTCTKGAVILFPPKCVHSIALARGSSPVQYDVIKFDPNLLPSVPEKRYRDSGRRESHAAWRADRFHPFCRTAEDWDRI